MSGPNSGRKLSEEWKRKISEANKGKKRSKEIKKKMSLNQSGSGNNNWKGDNACYATKHWWVKKHKILPETCEICGKPGNLQLSNKDHRYTRDLEDWQFVHAKCHLNYDIENNLRGEVNKTLLI